MSYVYIIAQICYNSTLQKIQNYYILTQIPPYVTIILIKNEVTGIWQNLNIKQNNES